MQDMGIFGIVLHLSIFIFFSVVVYLIEYVSAVSIDGHQIFRSHVVWGSLSVQMCMFLKLGNLQSLSTPAFPSLIKHTLFAP